jgi:hypothetical protein
MHLSQRLVHKYGDLYQVAGQRKYFHRLGNSVRLTEPGLHLCIKTASVTAETRSINENVFKLKATNSTMKVTKNLSVSGTGESNSIYTESVLMFCM